MAISNTKTDAKYTWAPLLGVLASIVFVMTVLSILIYFDVHEQLVVLLEWIDDQGIWAAVLFVMLMALVVVFLLPGVFLTTGAGFVFGVLEGTIYVVLGTTLGAGIAFLVARYLFGERAKKFVLSRSKLSLVSGAMEKRTFLVVLLSRLIPFFPSKISNFVFGLNNFNFRKFLLGSLVGFIPFSLHNVYLGSIAGDLMSLFRGESQRSGVEWLLYVTGFLATVVAIVYFNRVARKALNKYSDDDKGGII